MPLVKNATPQEPYEPRQFHTNSNQVDQFGGSGSTVAAQLWVQAEMPRRLLWANDHADAYLWATTAPYNLR